MDRINVAIIGGGVVGCAIARELSAKTADVFLFERAPRVGMMTSTRNSGVLHSGTFYTPQSLKARLCLPGNRLTKEFCAAHGVPHRTCGKLVVATQLSETEQIEKLFARGCANGVEGLRVVDAARIWQLEPHITAAAALEVPSTGIANAEQLVKAYARVAVEQGAHILTDARAVELESRAESVVVAIERGRSSQSVSAIRERFEARCVINSAGLFADEVAALADGRRTYTIYPVRGEYAECLPAKTHLVQSLVYPLPKSDVLVRDVTSRRIHFTHTLDGRLLLGPTARYVTDKNDYERDRLPLEEFVRGARPILPTIELADLRLAYSGLRPQLVPPDQHRSADYVIERHSACGRIINLVGMESPAFTSAPAIAQFVAPLVAETLA
ncbi:MAG: NAD(P)/FAD-dependent oxidoreductase [Candidatus Acidiferrales bacterium]